MLPTTILMMSSRCPLCRTANVSDAMRSINLYFQTCESGFEPVLPKPCAVAGPAYTVRAYVCVVAHRSTFLNVASIPSIQHSKHTVQHAYSTAHTGPPDQLCNDRE